MEAVVYIIKSIKTSRYYIGETDKLNKRILHHNNKELNTNTTKSGIPWELYHRIECDSRIQSRKIERHIKRMKSRNYIENLRKFPEIAQKLLVKYA